jgi:CrcB protein
MSALVWVGVVCCGGLGALARFLVDALLSTATGRADLPLGTFAVNVSGAFLLGLLSGLMLTGNATILAGTAALGSYTTFSTWMLETHRLREDGEFARALANLLVSLLAGLAAIAVGRLIGGGHT